MWMPLEINSFAWKAMKENQECTSGDYYVSYGNPWHVYWLEQDPIGVGQNKDVFELPWVAIVIVYNWYSEIMYPINAALCPIIINSKTLNLNQLSLVYYL